MPGVPELLIILVIIVAVFGVGKLANIGGAFGKSVRDFRESAGTETPPGTATTKTTTTVRTAVPADDDKTVTG